MSLTKRREGHQVKSSQHSGRPQSTVRVTKNEVPDNHSKRIWGIAQVLAIYIYITLYIYSINIYIYIV